MLNGVGFFIGVKCIFVIMKQLLASILLLFAWSCKDTGEKLSGTKEIIIKDSLIDKPVQKQEYDSLIKAKSVSKSMALNEVVTFVNKMEKQGWISDTIRLKKLHQYKYLQRDSVLYIKNQSFYKIDFKNTWPGKMMDVWEDVDCTPMQKAKSIMGYFYYTKEKNNFRSDGVIEQWEFEDETQAKKAFELIQKYGNRIYFNTNPFACRIKNYVIIFQTRAMAFSYNQKEVFEKFIEDNKSIIAEFDYGTL